MNELPTLRPGTKVRFAHMAESEAPFTIKEVLRLGDNRMATLEELPGQYALHVFIPASPKEPDHE